MNRDNSSKLTYEEMPNLIDRAVSLAETLGLNRALNMEDFDSVVSVRIFFLIAAKKKYGDYLNLLSEVRHSGINFLKTSKVAIPVGLKITPAQGTLTVKDRNYVPSMGSKSLKVVENTR